MNWVLTENAHYTTSTPFEKFPDLAHLYYFTRLWEIERRLIVPKSRQMTFTWLFAALYLWDAQFAPSRLNFIQSKKEEDADQVLERANTIYEKQPLFIKNWQPLSGGKKTYCHLRFKRNRSHLWAIPEGPQHARSYTSTGYLSDETVFQDHVEEVMAAVGPTLGQRGRITMLSSAGPSAFELIAFDKMGALT